jgi:hypothetical protein
MLTPSLGHHRLGVNSQKRTGTSSGLGTLMMWQFSRGIHHTSTRSSVGLSTRIEWRSSAARATLV